MIRPAIVVLLNVRTLILDRRGVLARPQRYGDYATHPFVRIGCLDFLSGQPLPVLERWLWNL